MAYMDDDFGTMSPVHTINNAVLCAAALIYGKMNPDACVCEAVTGGLDTDCNGATVGAIAGIVAGRRYFGGTLAARLNDTIKAEFGELRCVTMASLPFLTSFSSPSVTTASPLTIIQCSER